MKVTKFLLSFFIFSFSLLSFTQAQTWEVYDENFKLNSRLIYDQVEILSETVRIGKKDSVLSLLSPNLSPAISLKGTEVYQYLSPWILVKGPEGIGAFHEYGQQALPLEYDEIQTYFNLLLARKGNEFWVFEKGSGKTTALGTLDWAKFTKTGMLLTKSSDGYSIPLSNAGSKTFELLEDSEGDYLLAKEPTGYGLINREGDYVMDPVVDQLEHNKGNFYFGYDENQYLLLEGGDLKANVRYNSFHKITLENGLMLEYIHGKLRRVMEEDGILLDAVGIEEVTIIGENLYNVRFRDGNLGLLSKSGWLVRPNSPLKSIQMGSDGLFPASDGNAAGFVNSMGEWVVQPQFAQVTLFSESLAAYSNGGNWGLLQTDGTILTQPSWDEIKAFQKGFAIARANESYYLLNSQGNPINQEPLDQILLTSDGNFLVEKEGKYGILDSSGTEMIPTEFDNIQRDGKDRIIVRKDGKTGLISDSGEILLPLAFEELILDTEANRVLTKNLYEPVVVVEAEEEGKRRNKKRN
ncbi:WG repeat-containing protein [Algoriphagus machipongonensis]|uniref:Uncharacterized protein n=1 Tax=Algoriphagus machipongonensis TaxID=388413 RepID=A3I102_9BACT|nr:WG repeat-containing protein [Algoriphagus machipongonensis]EAZ80148.1 hypothetical protein ALPR1_16004 [Algoriphagus machipongonensis]